MKLKIVGIVACALAALLVIAMSCKAKGPEYSSVNPLDVWEQDEVPQIYENGQPVPTRHIFNCRRDLSITAQRYFRLKINENRIETLPSVGGTETTIYRYAELKHKVKNILPSANNLITYSDIVLAYVDVTVEKHPIRTLITVVLSPDRPPEHNLYAPDGSDLLSIVAGDEVAEFTDEDAGNLQISLHTHYHILGADEYLSLDCEFVNL